MPSTLVTTALIVGMLISGSINTISKSAQNSSKQPGIYHVYSCSLDTNHSQFNQTMCERAGGVWNDDQKFNAPWTQTLFMFIGEMFAVLVLIGERWIEKRRNTVRKEETMPLVSGDIQKPAEDEQPKLFQPILLIPTLCDLTGTTLSGIGLLYVAASVWQMLRGSIILFTGTFSVLFLKRKLKLFQWVAMSIIGGLALVGLASVIGDSGPESSNKTALGIILVLAAQVVSATQMVLEETYLKERKLPPLMVTGMEGVFGTILMIVIVLPLVYVIPGDQQSAMEKGSQENSLDAFVMIGNNWQLAMLCGFYTISIFFYNFCGQSVTKYLSAVHRTLIDASRTIIVWVTELIMRYAGLDGYGEPWTKYSFLQLAGFALLLFGTLLYNGVIKFKFLGME